MAKKTETQTKQLNAAQRLVAIEEKINQILNAITTHQQSLSILADEIDKGRELTLGVARRLNAAIEAAEGAGISQKSVNDIIVNQNVGNLKNSVDIMVKENVLILKETGAEATDFIVARELSEEGIVTNPRLQFSMVQMFNLEQGKDLAESCLGKKAGDIFKRKESDPTSLEILEVYSVNDEREVQFDEKEA